MTPQKEPLSPFLWAQSKRPSIFATDMRFTGRYKVPENPTSITITKQQNAYSKAKNGNS